uniref:Uncharacterized protein n=1 Tax=Panagrolaimus sp. PS1159 TaxID=55785 RepID=A0AC35EXR3_9BILA
MSETPPPPPAAPAVRFRVVPGSDVVKPSKPSSNSQSIIPPPQRIRNVRPPTERLAYARPPSGYHLQRNEMPFSQPNPLQQIRRPTIIRQPIARIIRPINSQQQQPQSDNKKKLITILKSFLTRCSTTPEANMTQMIMTTEVSCYFIF